MFIASFAGEAAREALKGGRKDEGKMKRDTLFRYVKGFRKGERGREEGKRDSDTQAHKHRGKVSLSLSHRA